jgi:hypothetical protein
MITPDWYYALLPFGIILCVMWVLSDKGRERNAPGVTLTYTNIIENRTVRTIRKKVAGQDSGTGQGGGASTKG